MCASSDWTSLFRQCKFHFELKFSRNVPSAQKVKAVFQSFFFFFARTANLPVLNKKKCTELLNLLRFFTLFSKSQNDKGNLKSTDSTFLSSFTVCNVCLMQPFTTITQTFLFFLLNSEEFPKNYNQLETTITFDFFFFFTRSKKCYCKLCAYNSHNAFWLLCEAWWTGRNVHKKQCLECFVFLNVCNLYLSCWQSRK